MSFQSIWHYNHLPCWLRSFHSKHFISLWNYPGTENKMKQNFEVCVTKVLKDEGGYTNDPADSGGKTNFGITQKETSIDVKTITMSQAKDIYKRKYWDVLGCDNLPSGVDYSVFDYGVNSGVGRASKVYKSFKTLEPTKAIVAIN